MTVEMLIPWIVGLVLGAIEVPIFQWLKEKLSISGINAVLAVMGLSILIAVLALAVSGGFSPFDPNKLLTYLASVITTAQIVYGLLVRETAKAAARRLV